MGIGLGIVLLAVGLIFGFGAIKIDGMDKYIASDTLGWILVAVGVLAIVLSLVMNKQRGETRHVEERREV
ncbi:hypothetical protein [Nocardioides sp.]|uniref:hypothetical protein n=1 Tax=Nocardioides sp. TaxID=35761 RepID=UPI00261BC0BF|nr:hypothetical protein [Nocardioides sp.]